MASSESTFRRELIQDAKNIGCRVVSLSPELSVGIPDLYIKHPQMSGIWVELKFWDKHNKCRKPRLTERQVNWMRAEQDVNGISGWVCCVKEGPIDWLAYVGSDERIHTGVPIAARSRGVKWNVESILRGIVECQPR